MEKRKRLKELSYCKNMKFKELPKEKIENINTIMIGSPNQIIGSPWLTVYPCQPEDIFDNPALLEKAVTAAIVASGSAIYSCDVIRKDGEIFDIDRHLLTTSGSTILRAGEITKDFPEHHSEEIPYYYTSGSMVSSAPKE